MTGPAEFLLGNWKMQLTRLLLAKRPKAKSILVIVESAISGHRVVLSRERIADKLEFIQFDPYIQRESIYKELKKIRSIR